MRKFLAIILSLTLFKLIMQCLGNQHYGFHRDELLHLSVSEHLAWGYMEFPPMIAALGSLSHWLFDYSLVGVRLLPTLAGASILVLCCLMAIELGGGKKAVLLAGICILVFIPFYRNHTLFQPVVFDQLFWTLGFYFMIKYMNTGHKKFLLFIGITLGLGLLTKYTILVWGLGIFTGLLFYQKGSLFKNKWLYISASLAVLLFLPNLLWQIANDLPLLKHLKALNESQLEGISPWSFLLEQLALPFTFTISLIGIGGFFFDDKLKKYKMLGITALIIFASMWLLHAKAYYVFALYPLLFAAGAVRLSRLLSTKPTWVYATVILCLLPPLYFIPEATPIMPIEKFIRYKGLEAKEGRIALTSDYADMFGWEEQVELVDSVYRSLTPEDKKNSVLWAENYGEAGALKILGKKYGLPDPICRHGSFWLWGYGNENAAVWISLGNEKAAVEAVFEEVTLVKIITHPYAIAEENGIPLYIGRKPKVNIPKWWAAYENYVFD
ncbi:MAG: hypothetical protein ACI9L9_002536 [Marivirga sp.]|jgi:hypothetical protein